MRHWAKCLNKVNKHSDGDFTSIKCVEDFLSDTRESMECRMISTESELSRSNNIFIRTKLSDTWGKGTFKNFTKKWENWNGPIETSGGRILAWFLKIGVPMAVFYWLGNIPEDKRLLKMSDITGESWEEQLLKTVEGKFGLAEQWDLLALISNATSAAEKGTKSSHRLFNLKRTSWEKSRVGIMYDNNRSVIAEDISLGEFTFTPGNYGLIEPCMISVSVCVCVWVCYHRLNH